MKSPLFSEHFSRDNWSLLYFNAFRHAFSKKKEKTTLERLIGQKKFPEGNHKKEQAKGPLQQGLFEPSAAKWLIDFPRLDFEKQVEILIAQLQLGLCSAGI